MSELNGVIKERYSILEEIGRGGLTTVYKALDVQEGREVALKILAPHLVLDPTFIARFKREIKILKQFDHPNIVSILDSGEHEGAPFLVMPFFSKGTLTDRLRSHPLSRELSGRIIGDISSALAYAHRRGIVHRDIKPSNILLGEGSKAYLSDFGLVYLADTSQNLTGSAVIGTPAYMSPEQCKGEQIDERSDQYSLAIVLFQLATGHLPFYAETPIAVAVQQINEPLPRPRDLNPNLPETIQAVLLKALSKDPKQRYPSIAAFNQAFQKALKIALIVDQENGSWTARYYEITHVLSRIQSKARGWFSQPVFTKRYSLIALAIFLLLFSSVIYSLFRSTKATSDAWLQATIAAVYTNSAPKEGTQQEPGFFETIIAGTLAALDIESELDSGLGASIPITGGDFWKEIELFGDGEITGSVTPQNSVMDPGQPNSSPIPTGFSDNGGSSTVTPRGYATQTPAGQLNPSQTASPTQTWTPIPTAGNLPTSTPIPSPTPSPTKTRTPTPSATVPPTSTPTNIPIASPTEDVCLKIKLTSFSVKAVDVTYTIANNSSISVTISTISLNWPIANQSLKQMAVAGNTVWDAGDDEPPSQATGVGSNMGAGATSQLALLFKRAAASSGYNLNVTFTNGCSVSRAD